MWRGRPTWAEVNLDAVAHNARELKRLIGPAQLMAVVKANAYGHGATQVARTALENGATWLGVACVDEGTHLRRAGITSPILILGYAAPWEAESIVAQRLTPTVNTRQLALALSANSSAHHVITPVHLKVDTGLTRFGLLPNEIVDFAKALVTLPNLRLEGFYTHFATSDEPDKSFVHQQFKLYQDTLRRLNDEGIQFAVRHAANSGATLDVPETRMDLVRCGITLYGLYPSDSVSRQVQLVPALSLKAHVARLREVPPGTSVSYGRTYVASSTTHLALVPVGYADGLSRALSNKGSVLIKGRRAPIVGRVCMDQCVVDVQGITGIHTGDEAVIIGRQDDEEITADELAKHLGTINYEITCGITARVPRVYLKRGKVVATSTLLDTSSL